MFADDDVKSPRWQTQRCSMSVSIDPFASLELPEFTRSSTLSPIAAMYNPFSQPVVPVDQEPSKEDARIPKESWEEDLTTFDFKVPKLTSPASLDTQYSPLPAFGSSDIPPLSMKLRERQRSPMTEDEVESPVVKMEIKKHIKREKGVEFSFKEENNSSGSKSGSETKSQTSDSSEPPRKRKRSTRKRKSNPQSRRLRQENNKRAAARYRQKRKTYVTDLERKVQRLNQELDRKNSEVEKLQSKTSVLEKQIEYLKSLVGKVPVAKMAAALQMVVCVFAVVLGVAVGTMGDSGMEMSHHRKMLSIEPMIPTCHSWGHQSWVPDKFGGFGNSECFDPTAAVSMLRVFVHVVVVPILVWMNFGGFEEGKKSSRASRVHTQRSPITP
ncbi:hypothetical protein AAMO2058_001751600 [Amorphochlora amoebiformis]